MPIHFYSEDVNLKITSKKKVRQWITQTILNEKLTADTISYIFCNDEYLHKMNLKYLNHDTYTDIITFDYSENKSVSGDLFISYDRIKQNASTFKSGVKKELHRVMIHGVLHLCGYRDKTETEKKLMRNKENYYLDCLDTILNSTG
ncbi:MAG: putative rRNA maturation factor [Saprospiraceae bacterium]|jgi:probable rRNA maturation factor